MANGNEHLARLCYNNYVSSATLTVSSVVVSLPADNLQNALKLRQWKATGKSDEHIIFNLGSAKTITQLLGTGTNFTSDVTLTLYGADNIAMTSAVTISGVTYSSAFDNFQREVSSVRKQYWKLRIQDAGNGASGVAVGAVYLGTYLEFDHRASISITQHDPSERVYAYDGQSITFEKSRYTVVEFSVEDYQDFSGLLDVINDVGTRRMDMFLMLDASSDMFGTGDGRHRFTYYGGFNNVQTQHLLQGVGNYPASFEEAR